MAVAQARAAVEGLQDPAVELTLQRCCLNNSKASHLLRCNADRVDAGSLLHFDEGMAAGLASALGDHLWTTVGRRPLFRLTQADLACEKRAPSLCRPSWQVGSPLAPWLLKCVNTLQMQVCALLRFSLQTYDARTAAAWAMWLQGLPDAVHDDSWLTPATCTAALGQPRSGMRARRRDNPLPALAPGGETHRRLGHRGRRAPSHTHCTRLMNKLRAQERGDLHRLQDPSAPDASHDWLWAVGPHKGARIDSADEFAAAVRLRLGCGGPTDPVQCSCCGVGTLQCSGCRGEHKRSQRCARHPSCRRQDHGLPS